MFPDRWDDVKKRKNDFVLKVKKRKKFSVHTPPLKPLDVAMESF